MTQNPFFHILCLFLSTLIIFPAQAQLTPKNKDDVTDALNKRSYSPYADRNFPTQVYWGDTHLHTDISMDGWHLVFLQERQEPRIPEFEQVRQEVQRDFEYDKSRESREAINAELRKGYQIRI